ncbi:MAG: TolB protein, partial [Actinomycetota bacterium]|nr:TolB protein [Actinomycetota bacterium]
MPRSPSAVVLMAFIVAVAVVAPAAHATFPGTNGQIAFTGPDSNGQPRNQIFGLSSDGSKRADLTQFDQENSKADWKVDGSEVAFSSAPNGNNGPGPEQIWTMNSDGSSRVQITSDSHDNDAPSWSPDGSKIAYVANPNGPDYGDVFVIPSGGGAPTNLTNLGSAGIADTPDWSPDGMKIAYVGRNGPDYDVFTVSSTGGASTNLTNDSAEDHDPSWSPDGGKIAYASKSGSGPFHIWVMNADGSSKTQITTGASNDFNPSWSPDGTKIAFDRGCPNDGCANNQGIPQNGDIWVMDAAGTNA